MPGHQSLKSTRRDLLRGSGALALIAATPLQAFAQTNNRAKMKIGVIGSGRVGGTIGRLWVNAGHPILLSSRHPEALKELAAGLGALASAGTVAQAVAFGDAVFIAVPYGALPQLGKEYG